MSPLQSRAETTWHAYSSCALRARFRPQSCWTFFAGSAVSSRSTRCPAKTTATPNIPPPTPPITAAKRFMGPKYRGSGSRYDFQIMPCLIKFLGRDAPCLVSTRVTQFSLYFRFFFVNLVPLFTCMNNSLFGEIFWLSEKNKSRRF